MDKIDVLRYVMYVLIIIYATFGVCLLLMAVHVHVTAATYFVFLVQEYSDGALIAMVTGVTVLLTAIAGAFGIYKGKYIYVGIFMVVSGALIIIEIVIAIYGYTYEISIEGTIKTNMINSWRKYKQDRNTEKIWDSIQIGHRCCGERGINDYRRNIPLSCCGRTKGPQCKRSDITWDDRGCINYLNDTFAAQSKILAVLATVTAVAQLILLLFGYQLYRAYGGGGLGSSGDGGWWFGSAFSRSGAKPVQFKPYRGRSF